MDSSHSSQQKSEKIALKLSMYAGVLFVLMELFVSIWTYSQAVLLDAVYDSVELVLIVISIRLVPLVYKPACEKRPFGYGQVESLFIVIKGFMMASVTLSLAVNSIQIMIDGGREISFEVIAYFELAVTALSIVMIFLLRRLNKGLNSPMVDTEINSWMIDTASSFGMAFAFLVPNLIHADWMTAVTPYLDQIAAVVLSLFILPLPIKSIITGIRDLFLLAPEADTVEYIKERTERVLEQYGCGGALYDIVRTGRKVWISVYIRFEKDLVSVELLGKMQREVRSALTDEFNDLYVELLPEVEQAEKDGLSSEIE